MCLIYFLQVVTTESDKLPVLKLLTSLGVVPEAESAKLSNLSECYPVLMDGIVVGRLQHTRALELSKQLRYFKATEQYGVRLYIKIIYCLYDILIFHASMILRFTKVISRSYSFSYSFN